MGNTYTQMKLNLMRDICLNGMAEDVAATLLLG